MSPPPAPIPFSLDAVRIASPCTEAWEKMQGDERTRHCVKCAKNVYNIAGLTREEAASLFTKGDGRVCARIFRRHDGTVLTADCPVGAARVALKMRLILGGVAALLLTSIALAFAPGASRDGKTFGAQITDLWYDTADLIPAWMTPESWKRPKQVDVIVGTIMCPSTELLDESK